MDEIKKELDNFIYMAGAIILTVVVCFADAATGKQMAMALLAALLMKMKAR